MHELTFSALLPTIGITVLATIYLVAEDKELRARAWRLLRLLLLRR